MKLAELYEATDVTYVESHGEDIEVLINPTIDDLKRMAREDDYHSVRVMRIGENVYAFPAAKSTHDFMAIKLDLPWKQLTAKTACQFTMTCNGLKLSTGLSPSLSDWCSKPKNISESFEAPYPVKCVEQTDQREVWKFETANGQHYFINLKTRTFVGQKVAWLDFTTREGITTVTGTGDSFRVFATVIAVLLDFIKRYSPIFFSFSGKGTSRKKLYDAFAKKLSSVLPGYHLENSEEELGRTEYVFKKVK